LEKEMINLFVNTFKAPYFEYLVGSSVQYFSDFVTIAERIEQAICLGRIVDLIERNVSLEKGKKPRFTMSKVVTKMRERTTKTKTSRNHSS